VLELKTWQSWKMARLGCSPGQQNSYQLPADS
jgi:hypothetical protein